VNAHFIVTTVEGVMLAICGEAFAPRVVNSASVGIHSQATQCPACTEKVNNAWVTFQ
jgi:hypothetical protein